MIFQDLDAALNPRMRIRDILKEAISVHHRLDDHDVDKRISELLEQVSIKKSKLSNFPHELSGGEKRRVGVARVLSVGAKFIVADEPVSALDVSVGAQIVNLLQKLQADFGLTYLFISHSMPVVRYLATRIAVMYRGRIVELGTTERIAGDPQDSYTRKLLAATPDLAVS